VARRKPALPLPWAAIRASRGKNETLVGVPGCSPSPRSQASKQIIRPVAPGGAEACVTPETFARGVECGPRRPFVGRYVNYFTVGLRGEPAARRGGG